VARGLAGATATAREREVRLSALLLALSSVFFHVSPALAKPNVAVGAFSGPSATQLRTTVTRAVAKSKRFVLVPDARVTRVARTQGADLESDQGRAAVAHELGLLASIDGSVTRHGRGFELRLRVYAGATGMLHGEQRASSSRRALAPTLRTWLLHELAAVQEEAARAPLATPEPEPQTALEPAQAEPESPPAAHDGTATSADSAPSSGEGARALELEASVRTLARSSTYEHPSPGPRAQRYPVSPAARIEARWYPAAHFTTAFVSNVGVELNAQWMLPSTLRWGSSNFTASSLALGAALRLRIPIGTHDLGVLGGYGMDALNVSYSQYGERPKSVGLASRFVRLGGDARLRFATRWAIEARFAFLLLSAYGDLTQRAWFPHANSGTGWQAELSASYALSSAWSVRAGLGAQRESVDLHVDPNEVGAVVFGRAATGVVDETLFGLLGVALRL
jgi:hypothetical protein